MENRVNNHGRLMENGVTNGVDMNVKTLNTNGQRDIFSRHFPTTTVSNDDIIVPSQNFQQGLAVDWPNTGPYQRHHYILDNDFTMNPDSQFLVHLDTIPDYILLPKEYLFDVSASDLQVDGAQNHHSIVTGQQVDIPFSSNLHKENIGVFPPTADRIAAHHSPEYLNTHSIMNEHGNGEYHSSATKVNVDDTNYISTRVGNVVTENTEPLNNEQTFLVDSVDYANIPQEIFFKNMPMVGTRTNIPKERTSTNIINDGTSANVPQPVRQILQFSHNPESQSGKKQTIIDEPMLQTNQQKGKTPLFHFSHIYMFRQQVVEASRKGMLFVPVSQRTQINFTFTDNVRTSYSCNVNNSQNNYHILLFKNIKNKSRYKSFQLYHLSRPP